MPLSDWSEKQFLALTAGIVGGVLVITAGVLFYMFSSYNELEERRKTLDRDVKGLEKEANRLDEVKKKLEDESALKQLLDARVPEDPNIDAFIRQLNDQSKGAQIIVKSLGVVEKRKNTRRRGPVSPYEPITVQMECVGGYHQLGQFINRLEQRMERLVSVSGFEIKSYNDGLEPGKKLLDISLEIKTYKFNNPLRAAAGTR